MNLLEIAKSHNRTMTSTSAGRAYFDWEKLARNENIIGFRLQRTASMLTAERPIRYMGWRILLDG